MIERKDIYREIERVMGMTTHSVSASDTVVSLDLDSLDVVELVMSLEEAFDVDIKDSDVVSLETSEHFADYVISAKVRS